MRFQLTTHDTPSVINLPEMPWLQTAINGGIRPGGAYLLSGEPGGNKSTLAIQTASILAAQGHRVLLVLTEQSPAEVAGIIQRVHGGEHSDVPAVVWDNLEYELLDDPATLPTLMRRTVPTKYPDVRLIVVDSLQGAGLSSAATKTYQRIYEFIDEAKLQQIATLLVAHVTKGGRIAGPKSLEHKVDVAMMLRKALGMRQLFVSKNRFGQEIVEPVLLANKMGRLSESPHANATTSCVLGYVGNGSDLVNVQAKVRLPRLNGKPELNAPFLPAKRVKQLIATINSLPGVDLHDLSYSIETFIPNGRYRNELDLPLAMALLSAYVRNPLPEGSLFVGQVDLNGAVGQADPVYLRSLVQALGAEGQLARQLYVGPDTARLLADMQYDPYDMPVDQFVKVVEVRDLQQLLDLVWGTDLLNGNDSMNHDSPSPRSEVSLPLLLRALENAG